MGRLSLPVAILGALSTSGCIEDVSATNERTTSSTATAAGIPTYWNWPNGTQAGSRHFLTEDKSSPHQFQRVGSPHPVRYGHKSERFEVRDGDCAYEDCGRSDISMGENKTLNQTLNNDVWIGWSFYNQSATTNPWMQPVVGQWKINNSHAIISFKAPRSARLKSRSGNDNVFVELGDMEVFGGYDGDENSWGNACSLFNLDEVQGRWTDIVINTNFSTTSDGYLNIWVNDVQKCAYRGRIVVSQRIEYGGAQHRRGLNLSRTEDFDLKFPNQEQPTMVVYYDEYRVGPTREQVDIRLIEAAGGPAVD